MIARIALALLLAAAPGAGAADAPLRVVATTADLAALAREVAGGHAAVESIAAPEQDPHTLELKPAQRSSLARADVVLRVGLDHEPWLQRAAPGKAARVLDLSRSVKLLQTHTPRLRVERAAHVHAFGNPHYWLDPANARSMAGAIAKELAQARPAQRAAFEGRLARFLASLDARMVEWDRSLAPHRGTRIVVMHDSWSYLAERFGLRLVAAVEPTPGVPPSAAELAALLGRMREANVRVLVTEPHSNAALVRQVEAKAGARAVMLRASGHDYLATMDDNVRRLAEALAAAR